MSKVWIVDDEPTICWALKKELEALSFEVSVFASAESCIDALQTARVYPQVILLDVRLPGRSGLDLMGVLQQMPS